MLLLWQVNAIDLSSHTGIRSRGAEKWSDQNLTILITQGVALGDFSQGGISYSLLSFEFPVPKSENAASYVVMYVLIE